VTGPTTLFIFPHAGGSPTYYVPFAKAFTTDIKRIAVQYPGKGGTHDLTSFRSIPDLADRVTKLLPDPSDGTVAFFGHSMGALVAFEVARRYEAAEAPISALFVSASPAPGAVGSEYIPENDRGLLAAVATMTGVNPEFLENEEFAARILPTLRGFKAIMAYECPPDATVSCPITAYMGDVDEIGTRERMEPWSRRTTGEFTLREFGGHHFYINDHLAELAADIESTLADTART
jgi:surfactin synthase thioesterase subunit